jgi:sugar phosphate permease
MESVSTFYVSAVLMAIGASLAGYFPLSVALVQWFEKNRARALSIMGLGFAMGGMMVPAMAWLIEHWGWRNTALLSGVLALVLGLPLARVIRRRPEDHGEHIDGLDPALNAAATGPGSAQPLEPVQFTVRQALRTRTFWLLATGHGLALLVVTAVSVHAITHMKEGLGYSFAAASFVIMLMNFGQFLGVLLGAAIGNKFEMRKVTALCMLSHALGLLALTYATEMAGLIAFAALHGLGWGLRGPFMSAIRADYFGRHAIGVILGLSAAIAAVGQVAGPLVAGVLADLTGDYRLGFTLLAILSSLGSLAFMLATRPEQKEAGQAPVS